MMCLEDGSVPARNCWSNEVLRWAENGGNDRVPEVKICGLMRI